MQLSTRSDRLGGRTPLVVVDAPGGPLPDFYAPRLLEEFELHVIVVGRSGDPAMRKRWQPLTAARSLTVSDDPREIRDVVAQRALDVGAAGVTAFSERVVHTAQLGALDVGLPANSVTTLYALRDKVRQREMLAAAGIPTPQQLVVAVDADTDRLPRDVPLPAVLKPATGMGSVGTTRIVRYDELGPAVRATRAVVAADPRIAHLHPPLVLEEELVGDPVTTRGGTRGDYVSVEAISTPRGTWVLAVQDKLPLAEPFRENGHLMPTTRPPEELADIIAAARAAVAALGIEHGTTHTELKLTSAGPQVIEVNGRAGGGVCEMLALAGSYDLPLHQARAAVDPGYEPPPVVFDSYAAYLTPQPPVGRWRAAHAAGMDELAREATVSDVQHLISVDAVVDSSDGTSSNLLRLFARAETQDELAELGARLGSTEFFTLISADNERTVR